MKVFIKMEGLMHRYDILIANLYASNITLDKIKIVLQENFGYIILVE